jgi:hypothetical protein
MLDSRACFFIFLKDRGLYYRQHDLASVAFIMAIIKGCLRFFKWEDAVDKDFELACVNEPG